MAPVAVQLLICFTFSVLFRTGCFNLSFCFCAHLTYFHILVLLFVNELDDDEEEEQVVGAHVPVRKVRGRKVRPC